MASKNRLLSMAVFLGWIFGCCPTGSPFLHSPHFKFKMCSFATAYGILYAVICGLISTDYFIVNYLSQCPQEDTTKCSIANWLSDIFFLASYYLIDFLFRFVSIRYCHKTLKVIRLCLRGSEVIKYKNDCDPDLDRKNRKISPSVTVYTLLALTFGFMLLYRIWVITFYFGIATGWATTANTVIFAKAQWLIRPANFFRFVSASVTSIFPLILTIELGLRLNNMFRIFCIQFVQDFLKVDSISENENEKEEHVAILVPARSLQPLQPQSLPNSNLHKFLLLIPQKSAAIIGERRRDLERYALHFKKFEKAYNLFEEVGGVYCALLIFQSTTMLMYGILRNLIDVGAFHRPLTIPGAIYALLVLIVISYIGELMRKQLKENKELITAAYLEMEMSQNSDFGKSVRVLARSIMNYKWKLTGMNLFDINYRLLPSIAGVMMTYNIFMFQLKVTEKTHE